MLCVTATFFMSAFDVSAVAMTSDSAPGSEERRAESRSQPERSCSHQ
jgi:hypothetical protein